jgi:hypothetical protein
MSIAVCSSGFRLPLLLEGGRGSYFNESLSGIDAGPLEMFREMPFCDRAGTADAKWHNFAQELGLPRNVCPKAAVGRDGRQPRVTWALEIGEVQRFSSIKKAISYCGLCGDEQRSGNSAQRTPLSKQRNKHLQTTLIEAAKMAPRYSPTLALLYDRERQKGNANRATLAVARKLVPYLMAVDRGQCQFLVIDQETRTAA